MNQKNNPNIIIDPTWWMRMDYEINTSLVAMADRIMYENQLEDPDCPSRKICQDVE